MDNNKRSKRPRMELEEDLWGDAEFTAEEFDEIQSQVDSQFTVSLNLPFVPNSQSTQVQNDDNLALEGHVKVLQDNLTRVKSEKEQLRLDLITKHNTELKILKQNTTSLESQLAFKEQELKSLVLKIQVLEAQIKNKNALLPHKVPKIKDISPIKATGSHFETKNSFLTSTHLELTQPLDPKPAVEESCEDLPHPMEESFTPITLQRRAFRKPKTFLFDTAVEDQVSIDLNVSHAHQLPTYLIDLLDRKSISSDLAAACLAKLTASISSLPQCQQETAADCSLSTTLGCHNKNQNSVLDVISAFNNCKQEIRPDVLYWKNTLLLIAYLHFPQRYEPELRALSLLKLLANPPSESASLAALEILQLMTCCKKTKQSTNLLLNSEEPTLLSALKVMLQKFPGVIHKMVELITCLVAQFGVRPIIHLNCLDFINTLIDTLAIEMDAYKIQPTIDKQRTLDRGLGFLSHLTYFLTALKTPPSLSIFLWGMAKLGNRNSESELSHPLYNLLNYDAHLAKIIRNPHI